MAVEECGFLIDYEGRLQEAETPEAVATRSGHASVAALLSLMANDATRAELTAQLQTLDSPLKRIKLKLFGHSAAGKSRLTEALVGQGRLGQLLSAVQRRFSDNGSVASVASLKDEGVHSGQGSSFSSECGGIATPAGGGGTTPSSTPRVRPPPRPAHAAYTRGIAVHNVLVQGAGEFSVWEFGGYEPLHTTYDHFVGNTDCVHVVVCRATDPTEVQYKQIVYWMNFLKGRVTPSEPIGHCGVVARRSRVVLVATHAAAARIPVLDGDYAPASTDAVEAMLRTVRLRFETHFDIHDKLVLLDSAQPNCPGVRQLRTYLAVARAAIVERLPHPLGLLDVCVRHLDTLRRQHAAFPIMTWPAFAAIVRSDVNPMAGDSHCRALIQQLQLIGEVVYLRDEGRQTDYVVLNPHWLGVQVVGEFLCWERWTGVAAHSARHQNQQQQQQTAAAASVGPYPAVAVFSLRYIGTLFPDVAEPEDVVRVFETLQLCAPLEPDDETAGGAGVSADTEYEVPTLITAEPPFTIWPEKRAGYAYGGVRVQPMRGMERSLHSTFPRVQVALRRSVHEFQDATDVQLAQWCGSSQLESGQLEALVRLAGDAIEVRVRAPTLHATAAFYFLEDLVSLVEQTAAEVAPGIALERHFLSPRQLAAHALHPATFPPEAMMAMQQEEQLAVRGTHEEDELFVDVVCMGSREVVRLLTLGIDMSVADLALTVRCELASLLDRPHPEGRDWSILAVKLNLADQLPEVDSTGQQLSRTDQLLAEWAIQHPGGATVGRLCAVLADLGRTDARDSVYRSVPLYMFAPVLPANASSPSAVDECSADSGLLSATSPFPPAVAAANHHHHHHLPPTTTASS